jgi:hypothetical protein
MMDLDDDEIKVQDTRKPQDDRWGHDKFAEKHPEPEPESESDQYDKEELDSDDPMDAKEIGKSYDQLVEECKEEDPEFDTKLLPSRSTWEA